MSKKIIQILITGGAGFYPCKKLLNLGNEVIYSDNSFAGNRQNIAPMMGSLYFEVRVTISHLYFIWRLIKSITLETEA